MENDREFTKETIEKGRSFNEVSTEYIKFLNLAFEAIADQGEDEETLLCRAMGLAVYWIYLLGVEDGMGGK